MAEEKLGEITNFVLTLQEQMSTAQEGFTIQHNMAEYDFSNPDVLEGLGC